MGYFSLYLTLLTRLCPCHAAVLHLLEKRDIPRKDFIADRELLRVRCRTIDQMDSFPSVLEGSIENEEVEMLAFPAKVKGIKTHVFFICPTEGNMPKLFLRFEEGFECNTIQPRPKPQEDLDTELKKRGWKCDNCGFKNLKWKSKCFRCRAPRPQKYANAPAKDKIVRPDNIIVSIKQELKKYVSTDVQA